MFDTLISVLGNSHFEAYVGGPIAGLLVAFVFSALGNGPPPGGSNGSQSPREVRARIVYHHHHGNNDRNKSADDSSSFLFGAAAVALIGLFLFSAFLPRIAFAIYFFTTSVAVFSIAACVLAVWTGHFNTADWWAKTIAPCALSLGNLTVAVQAYGAMSPDVVLYAQQLLGDGPMTVNSVINGAFIFFRTMDNHMHWIMFVMLAFVCVALSSLSTLLQCLHYLSLANARSGTRPVWRKLASRTERFAGASAMAGALFLLAAGWFFANGHAYRLLHG